MKDLRWDLFSGLPRRCGEVELVIGDFNMWVVAAYAVEDSSRCGERKYDKEVLGLESTSHCGLY